MSEFVAQELNPRWPTLDSIDVTRIDVGYDRDSDILLARFDDRALNAAVHYVGDYLALLVDLETEEVVGLQVEDFLARAVGEDPGLPTLLDLADLRGITRDEVAMLHASQTPDARKRAAVAVLLGDLARLTA